MEARNTISCVQLVSFEFWWLGVIQISIPNKNVKKRKKLGFKLKVIGMNIEKGNGNTLAASYQKLLYRLEQYNLPQHWKWNNNFCQYWCQFGKLLSQSFYGHEYRNDKTDQYGPHLKLEWSYVLWKGLGSLIMWWDRMPCVFSLLF